MRSQKIESPLFITLIIILLIDAFRTLFESIYFGAWYTSLAGLLPISVHNFLVHPVNVFIPKSINVVGAVTVLAILLYRWIPQENSERVKHQNQVQELERRVEERTVELMKINSKLQQGIEEHKQAKEALRESEKKYRSLFNEAFDMIHIADKKGMIIDANPIELEVMGYTREEYLGKHVSEISDPEYQATTKEEFGSLLRGEVAKVYETALVAKNGEKVVVEVSAVPQIVRNEVVGLHAISRDITERKKMEKELAQHSHRLEEKIRERTDELQNIVNVMTGREIRMAELKNVIEKLRAQIESEGLTPLTDDPLKETGKDYT